MFLAQRYTAKSAVPDVVGANRVITKAIFPSGLMVFALFTALGRLMSVESWTHGQYSFRKIQNLYSWITASEKPYITHDLFCTPADTRVISTIGATITFAFRLRWYRNQIVTIILTQGAAVFSVLPEIAVATVFRLLWGIYFVAQNKPPIIQICPLILGIKKERLPSPE